MLYIQGAKTITPINLPTNYFSRLQKKFSLSL
nr:MAG TPA: hypothetical protein [Caudoviricetes sp.]